MSPFGAVAILMIFFLVSITILFLYESHFRNWCENKILVENIVCFTNVGLK